jgi:hypothetical protein
MFGIGEALEVRLYSKLEKCEFHESKMEFLGYIIFGDDIHMDPHKVQTIVDWVIPASIRNVQCLLKFTSFYQCFIAHYSSIMVLIRLTRKDQPFSWGIEVEMPFNI